MTEERRRELWQMKLDAMPDDMIVSEYHRRLARRKWSKRDLAENTETGKAEKREPERLQLPDDPEAQLARLRGR